MSDVEDGEILSDCEEDNEIKQTIVSQSNHLFACIHRVPEQTLKILEL